MIKIAAVALIAVSSMAASAAPPAASKRAPAPNSVAPAPVPRTDFIRTMDSEFGRMDADKNQIVTKAEIEESQRLAARAQAQAQAHALFVNLDTDKNGQLSATEFERLAITPRPPNAAPVLNAADLNKDGKITLVEYRTAKLANFDRMDTDKDGVVSVLEMKAAGLVK